MSSATTSNFTNISQLITEQASHKQINNPNQFTSNQDPSNTKLDFAWLIKNNNLKSLPMANQYPTNNQLPINQLFDMNSAWAALCMATMSQQQINMTENNVQSINNDRIVGGLKLNDYGGEHRLKQSAPETKRCVSDQSAQSSPSPSYGAVNHSKSPYSTVTPYSAFHSNPLSTQYNVHLLKGAGKSKPTRPTFNANQIHDLELQFDQSQYLNGDSRKQLAKKLQMSEGQVKVWFQNRRTKYRKQQAGHRAQQKLNTERRMKNDAMDLTQFHSETFFRN